MAIIMSAFIILLQKMYSILKNVMAASILVALPRLSNYLATGNKKGFERESSRIINTFIMILLPVVTGTFMLSKDIIMMMAGDTYIEATSSLRILCISLVFSIFAIYLTNVILLPNKKEKQIMYATIISAVINVILNIIFIPWLKHDGAAITTTISEAVVLIYQLIAAKGLFIGKVNKRDVYSIILGCVSILLVCILIEFVHLSFIFGIVFKIVLSVLTYTLILVCLKHSFVFSIITRFKKHR